MKDVLCVILGGGRGTRLYPLTKYRAKPAVPVAGKYRLIDIPISNCLNSGFRKISILTQFNSESLNRHIARAYKFDSLSEGFVDIMAADQSLEHRDWFQGSADAVRKCLKHFNDPRLKYLLVLSGDQLYRMDFRSLMDFHLEKKSEITIACNIVPEDETRELGIMSITKESRIKNFFEKPKGADISQYAIETPSGKRYLASMGIYLFNKDVLFDILTNNDKIDFGREIIPVALSSKKTYAFTHSGYWKDIGSITSFYEENLRFAGEHPPLDLYDENWPVFTRPRYLAPIRVDQSSIEQASIAEGSVLDKCIVKRSIIGLRSRIGQGSRVEESILMGCDYYDTDSPCSISEVNLGIGKNCVIRRAIVDKNVRIGDNVRIENSKGVQESENELCVIRNGIIIIPKNRVIPSGTVI